MECTPIHSLPTHLLVKILWHSSQPKSSEFENDAYECLSPRHRRYGVSSDAPEKSFTPISAPPASADTAWNLLVASVCRDWRLLARRHVSSLSVREDRAVSRQDLANAVTRFPNLTHLHLNDGSAECIDDAFLAHLASACPKLTALHVGTRINVFHQGLGIHLPGASHPITEYGLDKFFQRCTRLEQLSLFCLHKDVDLPPSLFQLTHLRTLVLTSASALEASGFTNLHSLDTLHIALPHLTHQQFLGLRHLSNLINLSTSHNTTLFEGKAVSSSSPSLQLPRLKSLQVNGLFHSFLDMFPSGSPGTNLQRLELGPINFTDRIPTDIADLMPCLRELDLSACMHLTELPEALTSLRRLEKLRMRGCSKLSSLPRNLGAMTSLIHLELDSLRLTALPDSICQLTSLEFLSLLNCSKVRQLPADFRCLAALETLYLGRSQLLTLPDDIGILSNLKTLLLEENAETQRLLPSSFTQLSALTRLELNRSTIEELPQDIGMLSNLQHLHLCSCPNLTELPDSFSRLTGLEILVLNGCDQLFSSAPSLESLTRLKRLGVIRCSRLAIPPACLPLSLEILAMPSYNQSVPLFDVPALPHLRKLELRCRLVDSMSASRLKHLNLELAADAEDLPSPLPLLPYLHTLLTSHCTNLTRLPECIGSSLPQLRRLKLGPSSLRELPAAVCELLQLTSLEIGASKLLESLPGNIGALTRLRKLNVSGCGALQQLPASLTELTCLQDLHASDTSIHSLPSEFTTLATLRRLNLNGCWLVGWLPCRRMSQS